MQIEPPTPTVDSLTAAHRAVNHTDYLNNRSLTYWLGYSEVKQHTGYAW
jgi:hypothetical protein